MYPTYGHITPLYARDVQACNKMIEDNNAEVVILLHEHPLQLSFPSGSLSAMGSVCTSHVSLGPSSGLVINLQAFLYNPVSIILLPGGRRNAPYPYKLASIIRLHHLVNKHVHNRGQNLEK